ncbi:MAG TPA: protein kinase [Thermoanaerobaculia bacterium]|nr:protein kinase [Thermoanaerobaculia bacterium]
MQPGTQLGPYRVESLIGAGGMGEVYLATDTRLDRNVAIKILSKELSGNVSLRERFEREAKTISSLNHPNICSLFDLGHHEGADFLVMEYLQGETLADRIHRNALPADQVVRIGAEIANALDRAHKQGIVHRDLKPGNVMLTKSGVKLLDFGLAKLLVSTPAGSAATMATGFATEQKPLTQEGTILGTFQYMSPEQLEGKDADARSDIFALGAILYEMATGHRAFEGASRASLIASILDREPTPMSIIQPLTPPALERIVRACLAKDPDERLQTAHDVALELRWIAESSSISEPMAQRRRKKIAPWIVAGVFAAAAIGGWALYLHEQQRPMTPYTFSIAPPPGYHFLRGTAVSPDGTMIAFAAQADDGSVDLWVRRVDDSVPKKLAKTNNSLDPVVFWSPDSKWIGYSTIPSKLMRVRAEGGEPEPIAITVVQSGAAWGGSDTILLTPQFGMGLSRVSATGGDVTPVSKLDASRRESFHGTPRFLPDGKRYLYAVHTISEKRNEIYGASLDGGKPQLIVAADALIGYAKPYLLFVRDGAGYAQRFDPSTFRLEGSPRRVVDSIVFSEPEVVALGSVSQNGLLLYSAAQPGAVALNLYDRSGVLLQTLWKDLEITSARLSQDGKTLVCAKVDASKGANDISVVDLARGIPTRITGGLSNNDAPVLSPDGQTTAFMSDRDGMYNLYLKPLDAGSPERLVWRTEYDKWTNAWSPDGKYLLAQQFVASTKQDIWVVPLSADEKPRPLVQSDGNDVSATFSPDGKWVAYESDQTGDAEVYVRGFPEGRAVRVSATGGRSPSFSPGSNEILFTTAAGDVMVASIHGTGGVADAGIPQKLFSKPNAEQLARFTADGKILIGERQSSAHRLLTVTTAWRKDAP